MNDPKTLVETETPQSHGFHLSPDEPPDPEAHGPFAAIRRVLPGAEVIRFLMVGVSNTAFSLALYSACVIAFSHLLPHRGKPLIADIAFAISTPAGITVAFLCYKHFVFRTNGNYFKEWVRCFAVYSVSFPMGSRHHPHCDASLRARQPDPPVRAVPCGPGANSVVIACYSYFAHKKFSFKR